MKKGEKLNRPKYLDILFRLGISFRNKKHKAKTILKIDNTQWNLPM